MRNGPDLLASCTSLFLLAVAMAACFLVIMFSWPQPREHARAARSVPDSCCDTVIGVAVVDGVEILPAAAQTASFTRRPAHR